ncbi:MAG: hypothetical protein AB9834_02505 [Lentimicrobium sp.]
MGNFKRWLIFVPVFLQLLSSCKDEKDNVDPPPAAGPELESIGISPDNDTVTVEFSEGVFKAGVLNQPLSGSELEVTLSGGQSSLDSFRVIHTSGEKLAAIRLYLKGIADGNESVMVKPAGALKVVNQASIPMKETEQISISLADIGIIGRWVSTGENLSPVFQQFGFDSVYMHFKADNNYTFESFTTGGIHNLLSGTYTQNISTVSGIRQIVLDQALPVAAVISGIFSLQGTDTVMMVYETVQTQPVVTGLTPPTPELGFGSTGLLGSDNTQKFIRVKNN